MAAKNPSKNSTIKNQKKSIHIGFSHLDAYLWAIVSYCIKDRADKLGLKLTVSSVLTIDEQIAGIKTLIKQRVDVLMVSPIISDHPSLTATLKEANSLGIPIIAIGSKIEGDACGCIISSDNIKGQAMIMDHLLKSIGGKIKIAHIEGRMQLESHILRSRSVNDYIKNKPGAAIVFREQHDFKYTFEEGGRRLTQEILTKHPEANVIITATDRIALGAIEIVEEAGLTGKIHVTGFDGLPQALQAIKSGKLLATVSQDAHEIAEHAVQTAQKMAQGDAFPARIFTESKLVTKKNVIEAVLDTIDYVPRILQHITDANKNQRQFQQSIITSQHNILKTTSSISHAMRSILSPDEITQQIASLIRNHFSFSYVGLFLLDESEHILLSAKSGSPSKEFEKSIDLNDPLNPYSIVDWCVLNKKVRTELGNAELVLPLSIGDQVIGALAIQSSPDSPFNNDDIIVLQTMADQAAVALQNAKLYNEQKTTLTFLDSIIDNLPVTLFVKDAKDLKYLRYNKTGEALYGISRDQVIGKTAYDRFSKETADMITKIDRQILETGKPIDIPEEIIQGKDKQQHILHTRKLSVPGPDGQPKYILGISEDITEQKKGEAALRESEERFRSLTHLSSDWYWEQDENYCFTFHSDTAAGRTDRNPNDYQGKKRWDYPALNMTDKDWKAHIATLDARQPFHDLILKRNPSGNKVIYVSISGEPIFDSTGNFKGYRGIGKNITEQKESEIAVRESEERFRNLTELSSDWYWEQDENYRFTFHSGFGEKAALSLESILGKTRWDTPAENMTPEDWKAHITALDARQPFYDLVLKRTNEKGKVIYVSVSGKPIFNSNGVFKGYRGTGKNITAKKLAEEKIQFLAYHDGLTSLPNRSLFTQRVNHALVQAKRYKKGLAILFIDLDRFKNINDTLGHESGDKLLKQIAERLKNCLREGDTIARLGGDEFVVLLEEVGEVKLIGNVARKLLANIVQPITIDKHEYQITASIGVSIYPDDGHDEQTLMKNADIAMYLAKEQGKNNYQFYSAQINVHSFERLALESNLRRALENNEFIVHYQAKIDINTNEITGTEALVRWKHPDLGLVSPAQFIPLAEETGLIIPIGKFVLRTACIQNVAWHKQGFPKLRIAVNLSPRQFADENLIQDVKNILEETGMDASLLELEITESMVMYNTEKAIRLLQELKDMGVYLAIDDFGIGYSSLALLKRFPIDTIKIDRSFIKDIPADPEDAAITDAIITMGKALNLKIVAEGVEKKEQLNFLHDHHCDEMQGFYFSKPISSDDFDILLQNSLKTKATGSVINIDSKKHKK